MNDAGFSRLEPELLSIRKLAQILDCSPKTVRDWLYKDRKRPNTDPLPYYRLGGLVRFRLREVMSWIERRRVRVSSLDVSRLSR
jgi:excisionase family DNA binding protein